MTRRPTPLAHLVPLLAVLGLLALAPTSAMAQRVGTVNSEAILNAMPEYQAVEQELDELSGQWQKAYEKKKAKVDSLWDEYQARKVLLAEEDRVKWEEDIKAAEEAAAKYRAEKFGYEGELFTYRKEKMQPILDRVIAAVELVAKEQRVDVMLDKAGSLVILYVKADFDHTATVLKKLGVAAQAAQQAAQDGQGSTGAEVGGR